MPKPKSISSIELRCSLCTKSSKFSDVSHLLTHISSKAHLSTRFKLQIRSQSEPEAKQMLEDFDYWYTSNNLDRLLSDRLAAKDSKKGRKKTSLGSSVSNTLQNKQPKKLAPESARATTINEGQEYRAPVPRMHLWTTGSSTNNTTDGDWEETLYATPTARRFVPNFTRKESVENDNVDPNLDAYWGAAEGGQDGTNEEERFGEKLTEGAKLKGITWPGMNIFDSATPEMKRMRNQRKDNNILEDMIATSKEIEPAEISYHPNGEF